MRYVFSNVTRVTAEPPPSSGTADWESRSTGEDVVWAHNFDSADEVDQFRWTGSYGGGNDPNASGSGANYVSHIASGGPDGGGFLRVQYPISGTGRGNSYWWRPFSALTAATNGIGVDDPAASNTITRQAFSVTDGGQQTNRWCLDASNPGWYGHATHQSATPTKFQGNDFYLQIRVRRAQTPGQPPDAAPYTLITGKSVWFSTTNATYTFQELVTYGQSVGNGDAVGTHERHNVYNAGYGSFYSLADMPSGGDHLATVTTSNITEDWRYSGGWDTLLYHVTPGTYHGTGADRTRIEVWAQHDLSLFPAEDGVYEKIWDTVYSQDYDTGTGFAGGDNLNGWNALILAAYHNGSNFATTDFQYDYSQIIFSKATIAAPTLPTALESAAAAMAAGEWYKMTGVTGLSEFASLTGAGEGAGGIRTAYCNKFAYDPSAQKFHYVSGDHAAQSGRFDYDWATNTWTRNSLPWSVGSDSAIHGYQGNAWATSVGKLFFHRIGFTQLYRWESGTTWTDYSYSSALSYNSNANAVEYFPDIDKIMVFQRESGSTGKLIGINPDTGAITTYGSGATFANTGDPHNFCLYNPTSNIIWFGGGNAYSDGAGTADGTSTWKMDASGTITPMTAIPGPIGSIGPGLDHSLPVYNPANGKYLVFVNATTYYDFDPAGSGTWTAHTSADNEIFAADVFENGDPTASTTYGTQCCPLPDLGVIVFIKAWARNTPGEMWLYKP